MKTAYLLLSMLLVVFQSQNKPRRTFSSPAHYLTAADFNDLNERNQNYYVIGLMDGFRGGALFEADEAHLAKLTACTKEMDSKQVAAIITKYVKDHPEAWHLPMSIEAYNALNVACLGRLKVQ